MNTALGAIVIALCGQALCQDRQASAPASPSVDQAAPQDAAAMGKSGHVLGTYKAGTPDVEAALKGPIPDIDFAFKNATGEDIFIWFKADDAKPLFQGGWWQRNDMLYQLDANTGGTLVNGRYDDLTFEFWEPRMSRHRGMLSGNDDAVQLDCDTPKQTSYKTLSEAEMGKLKDRIKAGKFKIVPLPEPGKVKLHTPCEPFLGRH